MPAFYTDATLKFYRSIKRNQKKEWFEKNKPVFKSSFQDTSVKLIEALSKSPEFRALGLKGGPKNLFRIYRDVRFSNNKAPYKTHGSFVLTRSGNKKDPGVFYMHVEPGASGFYLGYWQLDPKLLATFRSWIVSHPEEYLRNVEDKLASRKLTFSDDDNLKRLPAGFREVTDERIKPALLRRSFGVWESLSDKDLTGPRLEAKIRSFVKRAAPLLLWGEALISQS
ncbi:MAG: DUF2461 domain-containing protein [Bdellovibrionota bacterium]